MVKNITIKLTVLLTIIFSSFFSHAQIWDGDPPPLKERLYFGGNFSLQFGSLTYIEIAPQVGYLLTPRLISGIGATYIYYKDDYWANNLSTHIFGGKLYSDYYLIKDFNKFIPIGFNGAVVGHIEYEALSLEQDLFDNLQIHTGQNRFIQHNVWVGGGVSMPIGSKSFFSIHLLWNLNEDSNSLEQSPIVRVGVNF